MKAEEYGGGGAWRWRRVKGREGAYGAGRRAYACSTVSVSSQGIADEDRGITCARCHFVMGLSSCAACTVLLETLDKMANFELLPRSRGEGGGQVIMRRMRPPNARMPPVHLQCESARRDTETGAPSPPARSVPPTVSARTATRRAAAVLTRRLAKSCLAQYCPSEPGPPILSGVTRISASD